MGDRPIRVRKSTERFGDTVPTFKIGDESESSQIDSFKGGSSDFVYDPLKTLGARDCTKDTSDVCDESSELMELELNEHSNFNPNLLDASECDNIDQENYSNRDDSQQTIRYDYTDNSAQIENELVDNNYSDDSYDSEDSYDSNYDSDDLEDVSEINDKRTFGELQFHSSDSDTDFAPEEDDLENDAMSVFSGEEEYSSDSEFSDSESDEDENESCRNIDVTPENENCEWTPINQIDEIEQKKLLDSIQIFPFDNTKKFYKGTKPINSIVDAYELFVDEDVLKMIVKQTNIFASQHIKKATIEARKTKTKITNRLARWKKITVLELKIYLGLRIMMGCTQKSTYKEYWMVDEDDPVSTGIGVRKYMSHNRFENISRFLHFSNNKKQPPNDRIYKIRNLINMMNERFTKFVNPPQNLCIDESLLKWCGRFIGKRYIPNKRYKYGLEEFKLCVGFGFTLMILLYSGKEPDGIPFTPFNIVMTLMDKFLNQGYILCTDNLYTSTVLAKTLLKQKTHLIGTLRANRKGLPPNLKKEVKPGEMDAHFDKNLGILVFRARDYTRSNSKGQNKNKKSYVILSTLHTNIRLQMKDKHGKLKRLQNSKTSRNKRDRSGQPQEGEIMTEPEARVYYSIHKDPVDTSDLKVAHCSPHRKVYKWYHRLADDLLFNTSVTNAYEIHRKENNIDTKFHTMSQQRRELYKYLLNTGLSEYKKENENYYGKQFGEIVLSDEGTNDNNDNPSVHHFISDGTNNRIRCEMCCSDSKNKSKKNQRGSKGNTLCAECNKYMCSRCFSRQINHYNN